MRTEDLAVLRRKFKEWIGVCSPKTVLVKCPTPEELQLIGQCAGPDVRITTTDKSEWDLENPAPDGMTCDVLVLSNMMMYSRDRRLWVANMSQVARYLWLQDAVDGRRGDVDGYLGEDGDVMRFGFNPHWTSEWERADDLGDIFGQAAVLDHEVYSLDSPGRHFVALVDLSKVVLQSQLLEISEPTVPRRRKRSQ